MLNIFAANLIKGLHIFLILFMVFAVLSNNPLIILINLILMFGIMFHWMVNSDICCLTMCEQYLRGKVDPTETFFGNLVGPVYAAHSIEYSWMIIIVLFIANIYKLHKLVWGAT
jgi:hypothetical protein